MSALLELRDVSVRYRGGALAVHPANMVLDRGQCAVVLGPNGAGKTSLVRAVAGFLGHERVDVRGGVYFEGSKISKKATSTIARLGIAYIPERDKIFRELTIRENLHVFTERRRSREGLSDDYDYIFDLFPKLQQLPQNRVAGLLSGGEQQMLALAGALIARPSVMLVDEPSLGLAPKLVSQVMHTLHRIRQERNVALLLVDQNVRSTARLATDMYTMHAGHLTHETGDDVAERLAREGYAGASR